MIDVAAYCETEVLIIGCGIAGGAAALQLADAGIPVTVITRSPEAHESNTYYAQGGIIYQGLQDSRQLLIEDILRAGAGHSDPRSAALLAEQGPALVRQLLLERVGVPFDRNGRGLSLAREGGHSLPRIIHAADATGKAIAAALLAALQRQPQVRLLTGYTAIELILEPGSGETPVCGGAYLLKQATGQAIAYRAGTTILATGGLGHVFERTSNPPGARGDGVAMADRAGVKLADMEFVQFHPTTFFQPQARPFLISEAVRGAGARLVDAAGAPFMQRYAPEWKDLAPRDIVARSIQQEMMSQDISNVYLDLRSYIPAEEIRSHFPTIYDYCLRYGVDITRDLVPVAPAAHYACGGVRVDEWGRTSLERLYAVGEVTCTGLHGANRLASTSLLEGLVWGYQAAAHIREHLHLGAARRGSATGVSWVADRLGARGGEGDTPVADRLGVRGGEGQAEPGQIERLAGVIRNLMWDYVGLVRTTSGLAYAFDELKQLAAEVELVYHHSPLTDELIGLRNIARTALVITQAALNNPVSQGCHYRLTEAEERRLFSWKLQVAEPALAGYNRKG